MPIDSTPDAAAQNPQAIITEYLTPQQVATLTGFSLRALEMMRSKRTGPAYCKMGTAKSSPVRYSLTDIHAWMHQHREATNVAR